MSIATEIQRLQSAKADLKTAIEAKGVTIPSNATIDTYDDYVAQITGGLTRAVSGTPYCDNRNIVVDVQTEISIDGGTSWVTSGSQYTVIVEVGGCGLPQGYTEVEYVENTTSAYLNLNVILYSSSNNSYRIDTKVSSQYYNTGNWECLFSCEQGNLAPYVGSFLRWNKYNVSVPYLELGGTNVTSTGITDNGDGTSAVTLSCNSTNATNTTPITLFCGLQGSTVWRNGRGKLYTFKVTLNNTLVRDLIPCIRDNDNMVGMYDIVNDVFYYPPNYSSYQFVAGNPV